MPGHFEREHGPKLIIGDKCDCSKAVVLAHNDHLEARVECVECGETFILYDSWPLPAIGSSVTLEWIPY